MFNNCEVCNRIIESDEVICLSCFEFETSIREQIDREEHEYWAMDWEGTIYTDEEGWKNH